MFTLGYKVVIGEMVGRVSGDMVSCRDGQDVRRLAVLVAGGGWGLWGLFVAGLSGGCWDG